ncbi:hypothetical protein E05_31070 [Plautia stali symbiont]|nr:hypothetical protein E05_31070 [Plautia stali symbiont]
MKRLVDIQGQPLAFSPDSQTAKTDIPQVASRAPAHPASGITPNRAALCLRAAERGDMTALVDLAADLEEKDTHLFSELSKRRLALHSVEWRIQPPDNPNAQEKAQAVALEERLADASWFDNALFDATDALLKGYAMQEIIWGPRAAANFSRALSTGAIRRCSASILTTTASCGCAMAAMPGRCYSRLAGFAMRPRPKPATPAPRGWYAH